MSENRNSSGYQPIPTGLRFSTELGPNGELHPTIWVKTLRIPRSSIEKGNEATTQNGKTVLRVNAPFVNVRERFIKTTGAEPYTTGDTSWIQVSFWGDQAKWFKEWALGEGMPAQIELSFIGNWRVNEFPGRDGSTKKTIQINVINFAKITKRTEGGGHSAHQEGNSVPASKPISQDHATSEKVSSDVMDDFSILTKDDVDLPF